MPVKSWMDISLRGSAGNGVLWISVGVGVGAIAKLSLIGINSPRGLDLSNSGGRKALYFVSRNAVPVLKGPLVLHERQLSQLCGKAILVNKMHKSVQYRTPDKLTKNDGTELQVSYQITPPHPARLATEAVEPFAANILSPLRSPRNDTANDLK